MLSLFQKLLYRVFPSLKPSVASLTADFSKKITQLQNLNQLKLNEVAKLEYQIEQARAQQTAASEEATKALAVAGKIQALLA